MVQCSVTVEKLNERTDFLVSSSSPECIFTGIYGELQILKMTDQMLDNDDVTKCQIPSLSSSKNGKFDYFIIFKWVVK